MYIIVDREALVWQGDNKLGSVCLFGCPPVGALRTEPFDLRTCYLTLRSRLKVRVKVKGHDQSHRLRLEARWGGVVRIEKKKLFGTYLNKEKLITGLPKKKKKEKKIDSICQTENKKLKSSNLRKIGKK